MRKAWEQQRAEDPAFPSNPYDSGHTGGISKRDYFAAKAMQGLLAGAMTFEAWEQLAERAYDIAEAMLAVRQK